MALDTDVHRENTDVGWVGFDPPLFYIYTNVLLGENQQIHSSPKAIFFCLSSLYLHKYFSEVCSKSTWKNKSFFFSKSLFIFFKSEKFGKFGKW